MDAPRTPDARGRGVLGAALLALLLVLGQAGLARALAFVPPGTRALGTGASVSTALFLLAGFVVGRLTSRRGPSTDEDGWRPVPWTPIVVFSLVLSAWGLFGPVVGAPDLLFSARALADGGIARAMLGTDAVFFAAFALAGIGAALGANTRGGTTLFGLVGALALTGLALGLRRLAQELILDPSAIGRLTTLGVGVAAVLVGFGLAWARRRLAFVEMAITALLFGYALYLGVAAGPPDLVASWSLPIEQILLALSIVPSVAVMALLAVGGSLGFLLFGSGRLDAGFGYEALVAKRYLQVNLRGMGRAAVFFVVWVVVAGLIGFAALHAAGPFVGLGAGTLVLALAVAISPIARGRPGRGALFSGVLVALAAVGAGVGGTLRGSAGLGVGLAVAGAVAIVLGLALRGPPIGRRARPPFVGLVTVISVVGVTLGVMALIVVLSVMSGFEGDLKRKILGAHAHVVVEKYGNDFLEYREVEAKVREAAGVRSAAAFVLGDAMVSTDAGLSGALVKGIDPASDDAVEELRANLERGRVGYLLEPEDIPGACGRSFFPPPTPPPRADDGPKTAESATGAIAGPIPGESLALGGAAECTGRVLPGIIIGKELSRALRAYVGDVVKLVSPVSDEIGPLGPTPKLRRFRVAGIFFSGMYEYDAKLAYVAMDRAQRFFGMREKATGVELKIDDIDASGLVVSELERRLGGDPYRVKDWREMNKELFSALLLEKIAMFVALAMIVMVASFLIVATLVMIVLQRGREIAILKSVGASSASVMKIFVIQGVTVGVLGALLGVGSGVGLCLVLQTWGLPLDERIFYIEKLPVVLDWGEVGIIAAAAVVISYLATIYPAMTAAILRPVDGLRDE